MADVRSGRAPSPEDFAPEQLWTPSRRTLPPFLRLGERAALDLDAAWGQLEHTTVQPQAELVRPPARAGRRAGGGALERGRFPRNSEKQYLRQVQ